MKDISELRNKDGAAANVVIIYHGNCADGFTSAWIMAKAFGAFNIEPTFHAGVYQDAPPDVKNAHVFLVDFSYKRAVIEAMLQDCEKMCIIDHHKTAIADLESPFADPLEDKLVRMFDTKRSGAGLCWQYCFPQIPMPRWIEAVQARDLWQEDRPDWQAIRAVAAYMFSFEYTLANWDQFNTEDYHTLVDCGIPIERKHFKDIEELLTVNTHWLRFPTDTDPTKYITCPSANLPYTLSSDAGHIMNSKHGSDFSVCWWVSPDLNRWGTKVTFSMRSPKEGGRDVSELAKLFGGGGHKNAAGFTISWLDFKNKFRFFDPAKGLESAELRT